MDISHHYIEKGTGRPLILLHGNGEDGSYFTHQIDALSASRRVIALDTRGHGKTDRGTAPFTIRQFASDLAGFMERLGIGRADLLGFSDGANIAMLFAINHPEKVDRLILDGGNLNPKGIKASVQLPIETGYRIAKLFAGRSPKAKRNAELLGLMVNDPDIDPGELSRIRARTLVIAGTKDMVKEDHTRLIARSIPDARLSLIRGDHFVARGNPADFNRTVADFLQSTEEMI
ncbi:MAG: alpha/beta hydrolase [Bacteroidales bacterium]|nr:alpha/beta hydrolase [Bacteroidales bacterium]